MRQVAEARLVDVRVKGSLRVHADSVMGHLEPLDAAGGGTDADAAGPHGLLRYGSRCGRVKLMDVTIDNAGIDWSSPDNVYWKHSVARKEGCLIQLQGRGEFEAHNVTLQGDCTFTVPDGHRMVLTQGEDGRVQQALVPLDPVLPSWEWKYSADAATGEVRLSYCSYVHQQPDASSAGVASEEDATGVFEQQQEEQRQQHL